MHDQQHRASRFVDFVWTSASGSPLFEQSNKSNDIILQPVRRDEGEHAITYGEPRRRNRMSHFFLFRSFVSFLLSHRKKLLLFRSIRFLKLYCMPFIAEQR